MRRRVVAVVGAGPVGALTALDMARNEIEVVVLEARDEIAWTSRAICISRRSLEILEILDRVGVAGEFVRKGLPWCSGKTFHKDGSYSGSISLMAPVIGTPPS